MESLTLQRRPRVSAQERARWISQYRSSQLSARQFAQQHGLKEGTFHRWIREERQRSKGVVDADSTINLDITVGAGHFFSSSGLVIVAANPGFSPSNLIVTGLLKNFNANTGTFSGGKWNILGTLQFDNANIVTNARQHHFGRADREPEQCECPAEPC